VARVVLVTAAAVVLQSTLARFVIRGTVAIDLVLIVVTYAALTGGPVTGLLTGTLAGLVQDALGTGVIGIGGLAKTVIGFLAGAVGTQFIVTAALPRFIVFFAATALHAAIVIGLYELLELGDFGTPWAAVAGQAVVNAIIGLVGFHLIERLPGALEGRGTGPRR
jgi:rod shape-determining protein MreD